MAGVGRHRVLALTSADPVLAAVAPIGLAAAAGTALIVDLVATTPSGQARTLGDIAADGPSLEELSPGRAGVAMIRGGGLDSPRAIEAIETLAGRWPAVVVCSGGGEWPFPQIPVVPLFPGVMHPTSHSPRGGIWQPVRGGGDPPGPGLVLPMLGSSLTRRMLSGRHPGRGRWVRAWARVWEMPWA